MTGSGKTGPGHRPHRRGGNRRHSRYWPSTPRATSPTCCSPSPTCRLPSSRRGSTRTRPAPRARRPKPTRPAKPHGGQRACRSGDRTPPRIARLRAAADFVVYTPGQHHRPPHLDRGLVRGAAGRGARRSRPAGRSRRGGGHERADAGRHRRRAPAQPGAHPALDALRRAMAGRPGPGPARRSSRWSRTRR